jgi:hypothetical protein
MTGHTRGHGRKNNAALVFIIVIIIIFVIPLFFVDELKEGDYDYD